MTPHRFLRFDHFANLGHLVGMEKVGDDPETIYAQIGILLLLVQDFERLLRFSISVALRDRKDVTIDSLSKKDRRTMGQFIAQVRADATLSKKVSDLLDRVLKGRNLFAHNLRHQPWFDLTTTKGRDEIWQFFSEFQPVLEEAMTVFAAFALDYGHKVGLKKEIDGMPWQGDFYERLKRDYMPSIASDIKKRS